MMCFLNRIFRKFRNKEDCDESEECEGTPAWAQFGALEMGADRGGQDITRPQIMTESVYGDSHPGSYHLNQMTEQAVYGVYERGASPQSTAPPTSATAAPRAMTA